MVQCYNPSNNLTHTKPVAHMNVSALLWDRTTNKTDDPILTLILAVYLYYCNWT